MIFATLLQTFQATLETLCGTTFRLHRHHCALLVIPWKHLTIVPPNCISNISKLSLTSFFCLHCALLIIPSYHLHQQHPHKEFCSWDLTCSRFQSLSNRALPALKGFTCQHVHKNFQAALTYSHNIPPVQASPEDTGLSCEVLPAPSPRALPPSPAPWPSVPG